MASVPGDKSSHHQRQRSSLPPMPPPKSGSNAPLYQDQSDARKTVAGVQRSVNFLDTDESNLDESHDEVKPIRTRNRVGSPSRVAVDFPPGARVPYRNDLHADGKHIDAGAVVETAQYPQPFDLDGADVYCDPFTINVQRPRENSSFSLVRTPYRGGFFSLRFGVNDSYGSHTTYRISCAFCPLPGDPRVREEWVVLTRYSELYQLDQQLRSRFDLVPFPSKRMFGSMDPSFISLREMDLAIWIKDLAARPDAIHSPELDALLQLSFRAVPLRKSVASSCAPPRTAAGREEEEEGVDEDLREANAGVVRGTVPYCRGTLTVAVAPQLHFAQDDDERAEHTEYKVVCHWSSRSTILAQQQEGAEEMQERTMTWFLLYRYRAFDALHEELQERFPELLLPRLPPKSVMRTVLCKSSSEPAFLQERRRGLGRYLKTLCTSPQLFYAQELDQFLVLSSNVLPLRRQMVEEQRKLRSAKKYAKEYEILNLHPGASMRKIRTAYHSRMAFWNTDKHHNHELAEEHVTRIRDAYHTLIGGMASEAESVRSGRSMR